MTDPRIPAGPHPARQRSPGGRAWAGPLVWLLLATAIGSAGWLYLGRQIAASRAHALAELFTIADLKVAQIAKWYHERRADAEVLLRSPADQALAARVLAGTADATSREHLLQWMEARRALYHYEAFVLYDASGRAVAVTPPGWPAPTWTGNTRFQAALTATDVSIWDLHRDPPGAAPADGHVHLSFWSPVRTPDGRDERAPGAWLAQVDPREFLFPNVQTWPTASRTAETLLVRRDGSDVVFLNDLRHRKNTALTLRFPIDRSSALPAAMAVKGHAGVVEGDDYRGVPVLAVLRTVPDTPWQMVAKVDRDEIFAPVRASVWEGGILLAAMLIIAGLSLVLIERHRDARWLQRQLATERERQALAARILLLSEQANDIILLTDAAWNILEANGRAAETYGYTVAELQRMRVPDLRTPDTQPEFDEQTRREMADKGVRFETHHQRRDGSVLDVESSVRAVGVGGQQYYQFIIRDTTDRKRTERALRDSEERFRVFMEHLPAAAFMKDAGGRMLLANRAVRELFGWVDCLGKRSAELLPPDAAARVDEDDQRVLSRGPETVTEEFLDARDRPRVFHTFKFPIPLPHGERLLGGVSMDITERTRAEAEVHMLNAELEARVVQRTVQLEDANRELETFAYSVSHDLRAPLRSIDGFGLALLEDYSSAIDERGRHYLDRMRAAAKRMSLLIDDLLILSRVTRAEMVRTRVRLGAMAERLAAELHETAPDRRVAWVIDPDAFADGDERLLEMVLHNLLGNAWKFTSRHPSARIEFGVTNDDGSPVYFVRDDGAGFDMVYAGKLFGAFQRLHSTAEFEGTGIGLATVQRIVRRHGGRVWAAGAVEQGATVSFTLS